jgi:hypothetical protein
MSELPENVVFLLRPLIFCGFFKVLLFKPFVGADASFLELLEGFWAGWGYLGTPG